MYVCIYRHILVSLQVHTYFCSTFRGLIHVTSDFTLRKDRQRKIHKEVEGIREN